jgi:hypothetical protein
LFTGGLVAGLSDAQLLERFLTQRDAGVFEALVGRQRPMVLSECRGILRDPHDAEDLIFSEFGRRVAENGSAGTDHGTAAPALLAGPCVQPGVHGSYPSLTDLDHGDLKMTMDFRRV